MIENRYYRQYYIDNKDRIKARSKEYYQNNKEKINNKQKTIQKKDPVLRMQRKMYNHYYYHHKIGKWFTREEIIKDYSIHHKYPNNCVLTFD